MTKTNWHDDAAHERGESNPSVKRTHTGGVALCVCLPSSAPACAAYFAHSALSDANYQLEGLEKPQTSSGLLASLMVTLFTVWVSIIVVLTSRCPSHS